MRSKKWVALLLAGLLCLPAGGCAAADKRAVFLDAEGHVVGRVTSVYGSVETTEEGFEDYVITAMRETVSILRTRLGVDTDTAYRYLFEQNYTVYTHLDSELQRQVHTTVSAPAYEGLSDYAVAITDLHGGLVASASSGCDSENLVNGSLTLRYPCSALKPLSVYTPLLEQGQLHWSSVKTDTPVKKVQGKDWPANADGQYTNSPVTVCEAVCESYNTLAVKWLQELTVDGSCAFLSRLGVDVSTEQVLAEQQGTDEVLGNLALGYLRKGVTAVDMAGYYQMFATDGEYTPPTAVRAVDREEKNLYTHTAAAREEIRPDTAAIMRQLLQEVVLNGTGREAALVDTPVGGKTGTSTGNADNWFVGFTPAYTCAVWHGAYTEENTLQNVAPRLFAGILHDRTPSGAAYPVCDGLTQMAYCLDTGYRFSTACSRIGVGYYREGDSPALCSKH